MAREKNSKKKKKHIKTHRDTAEQKFHQRKIIPKEETKKKHICSNTPRATSP